MAFDNDPTTLVEPLLPTPEAYQEQEEAVVALEPSDIIIEQGRRDNVGRECVNCTSRCSAHLTPCVVICILQSL
jgi:hypothetical protein